MSYLSRAFVAFSIVGLVAWSGCGYNTGDSGGEPVNNSRSQDGGNNTKSDASSNADGSTNSCGPGERRATNGGQTRCFVTCDDKKDCKVGEDCVSDVCVPNSMNGQNPSIDSFEIDPSTISQSDTGMDDRFFDVEIMVSGFEGRVEAVELQIDEAAREEPFNSERQLEVHSNRVVVSGIAMNWFQNLPPGVYHINATVTGGEGAEITERDLATVTLKQ